MHQKSSSLLSSRSAHLPANGLFFPDYVVGVIYDRPKDVYLMVNYRPRNGLWFPFSERRVHETSLQTMKRILESFALNDADQIHLVKVCSTKTLPCRAHDVLFYAIVPKSSTTINTWLNGKIDGIDFDRQLDNLPDNHPLWINAVQLRHICKSSRLLGIEPLILNKQFKDIFYGAMNLMNMNSNVLFEEMKIPQVDNPSKSAAQLLLQSAKFTSTVQEQIFEEFHHATVPSEYLNFESFKELMLNKGLDATHLIDYFRAFDSTQRSYLTYLDYVLGLAALDPNTQHGGVPAEQRCRYIFRYYNASNTQRMSFDEFKLMIKDIHKSKGQNLTGDALQEEALQMFRSFGLRSIDQSLNLMDFLSGVGQLRFRGTSVLFRLAIPIVDLLKPPLSSTPSNTALTSSTTSNRSPSANGMARRTDLSVTPSLISPASPAAKEEFQNYEIATHIVKVSAERKSKDKDQDDPRWTCR